MPTLFLTTSAMAPSRRLEAVEAPCHRDGNQPRRIGHATTPVTEEEDANHANNAMLAMGTTSLFPASFPTGIPGVPQKNQDKTYPTECGSRVYPPHPKNALPSSSLPRSFLLPVES